jgi:septum formation topological specificity factor MinE
MKSLVQALALGLLLLSLTTKLPAADEPFNGQTLPAMMKRSFHVITVASASNLDTKIADLGEDYSLIDVRVEQVRFSNEKLMDRMRGSKRVAARDLTLPGPQFIAVIPSKAFSPVRHANLDHAIIFISSIDPRSSLKAKCEKASQTRPCYAVVGGVAGIIPIIPPEGYRDSEKDRHELATAFIKSWVSLYGNRDRPKEKERYAPMLEWVAAGLRSRDELLYRSAAAEALELSYLENVRPQAVEVVCKFVETSNPAINQRTLDANLEAIRVLTASKENARLADKVLIQLCASEQRDKSVTKAVIGGMASLSTGKEFLARVISEQPEFEFSSHAKIWALAILEKKKEGGGDF